MSSESAASRSAGASIGVEALRNLPLPGARSAAAIATQLRQAIHDGVYVNGERLPAERQLAMALSSSRTTVREALRILENGKLVSRRVGSGTFVTFRPEEAEEDVAEITSPLELVEVRLAVEPHMVRLATLHATLRDLERIEEALGALSDIGINAEAFTKWDRTFHQTIAEATRNPLLISIYRQINHVRGHRQWNSMKDKVLTPESIAAYNLQHRAIYDALRARDADTAVDLVRDHLIAARNQLSVV
ncbi:MAG: FadR/GntR family transcriptional regulator [Proteobacteria bacterium]|nr:FadR/GntR family transcriptional regulator [Pseudomonadota bacterium]MDA0952308.1 FadR/GntR family transcriptional regulator [Pseudomonadota bacterium]